MQLNLSLPEHPDDLIPPKEVCRINGNVSTRTLYRWVEQGIIAKPEQVNGYNYWRRSNARVQTVAS